MNAPRIDARDKVTGAARYAADHRSEDLLHGGLLHAGLVAAPIAAGRIIGFDLAPARAIDGVVDIVTHETAPRLAPSGPLMLLQGPDVHFAGQAVAVVVARTALQARLAAAAVGVRTAPEDAVTAMRHALDRAYAPKTAGLTVTDSRRGDPERTLREAPLAIERHYATATSNHHPIEPHAVIAWWDADGLTVRTTSQAIFSHRRVLAACFGLPPERVRVISPFLGGGFGAKGGAWTPCLVLAAMVARHVDRPVKLELTRAQMFTLTGRRQETMQRLRLAATRDGQLTAIDHETVAQTSVTGEYADPVGTVSRMLYACPNVATRHRLVRVNAPQPNPARAPGEGPGSFALETALDELAAALALDPLALRRRNFAARDQHADLPWSSNGLRECWRVGAHEFGWDERWHVPGSRRDGREAIGWGMASACYPAYRAASSAEAAIDRDDRITVRCGTQDIGTGTCTVLAQLAAETLGVPLARVAVELGDTRLPEGPASAGARATASFAPAVEEAARALRARLAAGERTRPLVCAAEADPAAPQSHSAHGFGAVFVEVRVDTQLATVRVVRLTAAYAIGRIVNPLLARSQLVGGLVGGIGMALHEESVTDERLGRVVNHSLADYLMPTHADMPAFDVHLIDERDPHLASGIKGGVGMIGTVGTAAAIANAVYHATGRRVRTLPIRCERLL